MAPLRLPEVASNRFMGFEDQVMQKKKKNMILRPGSCRGVHTIDWV